MAQQGARPQHPGARECPGEPTQGYPPVDGVQPSLVLRRSWDVGTLDASTAETAKCVQQERDPVVDGCPRYLLHEQVALDVLYVRKVYSGGARRRCLPAGD
uniref:(northern house mosquito) hypothetical protein n=1 Tax=Culex pipiens TaxID=7175 RepID=A0A8D8FZV8_CULPI